MDEILIKMSNFVIGKKTDMTQLFDEDGRVVPVTIIQIDDNKIVDLRTEEKDGYKAIVIGSGFKKNATKAENGRYKNAGFVPRYVREFRVESTEEYQVGDAIDIEKFDTNLKVDITGISKGKGFQGVVRKFDFAGGPKTHGQSDRHRAAGSIGSGTTPGRVYKGKKMPGRLGYETTTVKNLKIIKIDKINKLIAIKGAVPGRRGALVKITQRI
jgi:large subunit ribosomal protein L3